MPNIYEITDPSSGKTYRMEADDGITQEQALEQFQSIPQEEWNAFEYSPPVAPEPTAAPTTTNPPVATAGAVPNESIGTSTVVDKLTGEPYVPEEPLTQQEIEQRATGKVTISADHYKMGMDNLFDFSPTNNTLADVDREVLREMANDPTVPLKSLNIFMQERGVLPFSQERLDEIAKAREEGILYGSVVQENPVQDLVDTEALAVEYSAEETGGDNWFAQISRSITEGWADPASLVNYLSRSGADLFDLYQDELKEKFPDATPEELDQLEDMYIAWEARKISEAAQLGVSKDDTIPWLVGQFLAIEPYDLIPIGRGASAARKASRFAEVSGKRARDVARGAIVDTSVAAIGDVVGQGLAMADGAQDEFDPLRTAASAALTGALSVGLNAIGREAGRSVRPSSIDTTPSGFRNSEVELPDSSLARNSEQYRTQLSDTSASLQTRATEMAGRWTNAPSEVSILPSFTEENAPGIDSKALGVYTEDGRVLLNTDAIIRQAERRNVSVEAMTDSVMFHEALGHHGLTQMFGGQLDEALDVFYTRGAGEFRDVVDTWITKNPKAYADGDPNGIYSREDYQRIRATEEVLAEWSEKDGNIVRDFYDVIANLVKNTARRIGVDFKYSSREVKSILAVSQENVRSGNPTAEVPGVVKNATVYHGSGTDFHRFDHSFMGSGEGQQVFGWGTYLTDVKNIAEEYRSKFSRQDTSFGGRRGPIWQLRDIAKAKAEEAGLSEGAIDALDSAFSVKSQFYPDREITGRTVYDNFLATVEDPDWPQMPQEFRDSLDEAAKFVNDNYKVEYSGKVMETEIPDDAKWLEWENPLSEQPEFREVLKKAGINIIPDEEFHKLNVEYAQKFAEHQKEGSNAQNDFLPEVEQDRAFRRVQELAPEVQALRKKLENVVGDETDGRDIYAALSEKLGGDEAASKFLRDNGFTGNRYLANNLHHNQPRKNDGSDKFNYVVFDDQTPKIVNKYMRGDDPIDPTELTAEDLVASEDALKLLERVTRNYQPTPVEIDSVVQDLTARNVQPNQVIRLAQINPGELVKRRLRYDIAAQKLNERALDIMEDIRTKGFTPEKEFELIKTEDTLEIIAESAFKLESEFARALNANKRMVWTRNKANTLKEYLKKTGREHLSDPEEFLRYMQGRKEALEKDIRNSNGEYYKIPLLGRSVPRSWLSVTNFPRAIMSSMDLSAPLRQGLTFVGNPEWVRSFITMFSMVGKSGKRNYDYLMKSIGQRDTYDLMLRARLAFSDLDGKLSSREEDFQSDLARKVPGVKWSEQAYSGFLNKLRADMFDKYIEKFKGLKDKDGNPYIKTDADGNILKDKDGNPEIDPQLLLDLGRFINSATGRAELVGGLKSMAPQLNTVLFSPRLIQSRVNIIAYALQADKAAAAINGNFAALNPIVRKELYKELFKMGSIAALTMGAAIMMVPDAEVEIDPRSSDFLKIKIGDTRYDILGGYGQYLTFATQYALWQANQIGITDIDEKKSASTGKTSRIEKTNIPYSESMFDRTWRFVRGKLSPDASFVVDALDGENVIGTPFKLNPFDSESVIFLDPDSATTSRIMPMHWQSMVEAANEETGFFEATLKTMPGLFGVGISTYGNRATDPEQRLEVSREFSMKDAVPGSYETVNIDEEGVVTLSKSTHEQWEGTVNNYFKQLVEIYASETGQAWENLPDEAKKEIIENAKSDARKYAKEDMLEIIFED